jgi:hypothetical protein
VTNSVHSACATTIPSACPRSLPRPSSPRREHDPPSSLRAGSGPLPLSAATARAPVQADSLHRPTNSKCRPPRYAARAHLKPTALHQNFGESPFHACPQTPQ